MSVRRLEHIPGFSIDRVAAAAGDDPDVLRLENLDTDIPPPAEAIEATRAAIGEDEANSWLPFTGRDDLKESVAAYIERRGGPRYGRGEIVITCGEGDAMLNALFCLTDPGDEVVLTDPTYAGMLNRVRLVGASPRPVSLRLVDGERRPVLERPSAGVALRLHADHVDAATGQSQRRRDGTLRALAGLPAVRQAGGWSLLLDIAALGLDCVEVSNRLLEEKVAATLMRGWGGEVADRHVRFVFSNEPVERLALLGPRVRAALTAAS